MLVIEDCEATGNILFEYLFRENVDRLVQDRTYGWQAVNVNVGGRWFHASDYEPSEGQLQHLRHALTDVDGITRFPEPFLYEPKERDLEELREKLRIPNWDERVRAVVTHFRDHARSRDSKNPTLLRPSQMIIVTDLALSQKEGDDLVAVNAILDDEALRTRGPVPGRRDLRPKLRESTGYQIIEMFGNFMPVIATTFMNNPLIHQHCLLGGACAVVPKPAFSTDESGAGFDMQTGNGLKHNVLEDGARTGSDMLHVVVSYYVTRLVAEVLTAIALKRTVDG